MISRTKYTKNVLVGSPAVLVRDKTHCNKYPSTCRVMSVWYPCSIISIRFNPKSDRDNATTRTLAWAPWLCHLRQAQSNVHQCFQNMILDTKVTILFILVQLSFHRVHHYMLSGQKQYGMRSLPNTSTHDKQLGNRTPYFLILSPMPCPLGPMLPCKNFAFFASWHEEYFTLKVSLVRLLRHIFSCRYNSNAKCKL